MGALFVLGSINQDFVLRLERRPEPGETVTDAELSLHPGGKGANGAIAAARLGAEVAMLGRVGEDATDAWETLPLSTERGELRRITTAVILGTHDA